MKKILSVIFITCTLFSCNQSPDPLTDHTVIEYPTSLSGWWDQTYWHLMDSSPIDQYDSVKVYLKPDGNGFRFFFQDGDYFRAYMNWGVWDDYSHFRYLNNDYQAIQIDPNRVVAWDSAGQIQPAWIQFDRGFPLDSESLE